MAKDWVGGSAAVFKTLGASNHTNADRQREDYYATEPKATEWLCKLERFEGRILEPSCGEGYMSRMLEAAGYEVVSRDLVDRGYGEVADFLAIDNLEWDGNIVTNPPYKYAQQFVEKALSIIPVGKKVAMFLKLTFLEGKARRALYRSTPPVRVWVSSSRLKCAMNGDFDKYGSSAAAYAWFVWEKGYKGETTVKWFNRRGHKHKTTQNNTCATTDINTSTRFRHLSRTLSTTHANSTLGRRRRHTRQRMMLGNI